MKAITRRLYKKPVMAGMLFLLGVALLVGLSMTSKSDAMQSGFPVVAGNDEFETTANGETHHDFAGSPIPADFFGAGSLAFAGTVTLEGVPLTGGSDTDTIIQRHQTVSAPGGSTQLTMTGLSLRGTRAITVTYSNGNTESWEIRVGLSLFKASTGSMTIHSTTFDSTLKVWPRFTFKRIPDGLTKVLDTGGSGLTTASTAAASTVEFDNGEVIISPDDPTPLPRPCTVAVVKDFEAHAAATSGGSFSAAAASSCPPLTLTATSPWFPCPPTGFCKPPLTEAERWARHNASPPGTKKQLGSAE